MRRLWLLVFLAVPAAPAQAADSRYSLAGGCYRAVGVPGAEQVRMQPTTLGRYLLYRPDGTFVTAGGSAKAASPAAEWNIEESGGAFTLTPQAGGKEIGGVRFEPASGCAEFPEADVNARGAPWRGKTPYGPVEGIVDGHMHWMTFEYLGARFHCGQPWHPYGIAAALPDCAAIEGPAGSSALFQNFLNYGTPVKPHDTRGYPELTEFKATNLTYEGTYWRWIERAWLAGLRLMVMSVNENRVLCTLQANRRTDCDEMATVRRGLDDIQELQRYADAQAGGPGKGFFQIVTTPYDARRAINAGKMAVVLEIEVSEPFGCRGWFQPSCDAAQVDRELDDLYDRGVRSALLLNKFDNPLTGVRFDSGEVGTLINGANLVSAGTFWSAQTCTGPLHDNTISTASPAVAGSVFALLGTSPAALPVYPPPPHCNTRGLTPLGAHTVERLMDKRMIVNPDHMSQAAVDATLTLLEQRGYSGVISPHGWMDPGNWPRLWKLGGLAWPGHSTAVDYVSQWSRYRPRETPYDFGWGYGADLGGLSVQPGASSGLSYPFKSLDGRVSFDKQKTGSRTFDYPSEGVAHYGLYADWLADLKRLGGGQLASDMLAGAEAYLEMWERADGVPASACAPARGGLSKTGIRDLRLGTDWPALLRRAGQPSSRADAWAWCVPGGGTDAAVLDREGRVALVASTATGRTAGGVAVGQRRTGAAGTKIRVRGDHTWVYVVSRGRVSAVGVATRTLGRDRKALRAAVGRVTAARVTQAPRTFVPGASAAAVPTGRTLAGAGNPTTDAALTLLCSLMS